MEAKFLCTVALIFIVCFARSSKSETPGESFVNSQNCSMAQRNESCQVSCKGFPMNRCRETLPQNQRIACICDPVKQTQIFDTTDENEKDLCSSNEVIEIKTGLENTLNVASCDNEGKKKCDNFCASVSRRFEKCVVRGNPLLKQRRICICRI